MSRYCTISLILLIIVSGVSGYAPALANPQAPVILAGPPPAAQPIAPEGEPAAKQIRKVKPSGMFDRISRLSPLSWELGCCLPSPAKGQFVGVGRIWFTRLQGQVSKGGGFVVPGLQPEVVDIENHLGIKENALPVWQVRGSYQVLPLWSLRYSYSPIDAQGTSTVTQSFTFRGQTFSIGTHIRSRWERHEHRAGLAFNLRRSESFVTSLFADWMLVQDRVSVGQTLGAPFQAVAWDDDKSLAVAGLEVDKCLSNAGGGTLALSCKGGLVFLNDYFGYEAEAGIGYLIPIQQGRFGFFKGGYRYAHLKKDKPHEILSTTTDGLWLEAGILF